MIILTNKFGNRVGLAAEKIACVHHYGARNPRSLYSAVGVICTGVRNPMHFDEHVFEPLMTHLSDRNVHFVPFHEDCTFVCISHVVSLVEVLERNMVGCLPETTIDTVRTLLTLDATTWNSPTCLYFGPSEYTPYVVTVDKPLLEVEALLTA